MEAFQFGRLSRQERESKANISSVNFDGHFVYHGLSLQILRKGESEMEVAPRCKLLAQLTVYTKMWDGCMGDGLDTP